MRKLYVAKTGTTINTSFSNYTFAKLNCEKCFEVKLVTMDGELCVVRVIVPKIAQRWMMERA